MAESRYKYNECPEQILPEYDRKSELQAFDDTKAGVKGLLDSGITKIPSIFVHGQLEVNAEPVSGIPNLNVPIIDFQGLEKTDQDRRNEVIAKVKNACEEWGIFQIVNHGIPINVMDKMIAGVRQFHELDPELKKKYYSREFKSKSFAYHSNFQLHHAPAANWFDTIYFVMAPNPPDLEQFPGVCRDVTLEYAELIMKLAHLVFEVLEEALGLKKNHLLDMECTKGQIILGHYYPACPEPDRTLGQTGHFDASFLTILLQNQIGGLQVLHGNQWIDVPYFPGAVIVNTGDLLQLITNGRFKSVFHRVISKRIGPRISVGSFLRGYTAEGSTSRRIYGPIKELISEENPAIYRDTTIEEYSKYYFKKGKSALNYFKL